MRHLCLAVVPPDRMDRLTGLDPVLYQWLWVTTWAEAAEAIRTRPVDIAVLDPTIPDDTSVGQVEQLRAQFPSLPLILYTTLSPSAAEILLRLGRLGIRRVVFARFEDAPGNLRRVITRELERAVIRQVLRSLDSALGRLPDDLRVALEIVLHMPGDRANVNVLAESAHLTPHACHEWFARAQLPVPRVALTLLRLLYAHRLLLDPGHTVDDVAQKLGYAGARTLQTQLRMTFGMTAGELRQALSPQEAAELLLRRYFLRQPENVDTAQLAAASG